jgi:hypothetical protein
MVTEFTLDKRHLFILLIPALGASALGAPMLADFAQPNYWTSVIERPVRYGYLHLVKIKTINLRLQ